VPVRLELARLGSCGMSGLSPRCGPKRNSVWPSHERFYETRPRYGIGADDSPSPLIGTGRRARNPGFGMH
jgi:hypothetical protein